MIEMATTHNERPVFFSAGAEDLFGIITEPTAEPRNVALILLTGGAVPAPNRNRLSVRIARRVAALGFHTLRFDYRGVGESTGVTESYRLDRPFAEDVLAGVRCLEAQGIQGFALAGTCFGARTALASVDRISRLRGVALLAPPVRDFEMGTVAIEAKPTAHYVKRALRLRTMRRLLDPDRRRLYGRMARTKLSAVARSSRVVPGPARDEVSPRFAEPLAQLASRGVPVLLAYGSDDEFYGPFREARPKLAALLEVPGARVEERLVPGRIHGLSRLAVQDEVANLIEDWLPRLDGVPGK